jgi:hypothetical protein
MFARRKSMTYQLNRTDWLSIIFSTISVGLYVGSSRRFHGPILLPVFFAFHGWKNLEKNLGKLYKFMNGFKYLPCLKTMKEGPALAHRWLFILSNVFDEMIALIVLYLCSVFSSSRSLTGASVAIGADNHARTYTREKNRHSSFKLLSSS